MTPCQLNGILADFDKVREGDAFWVEVRTKSGDVITEASVNTALFALYEMVELGQDDRGPIVLPIEAIESVRLCS